MCEEHAASIQLRWLRKGVYGAVAGVLCWTAVFPLDVPGQIEEFPVSTHNLYPGVAKLQTLQISAAKCILWPLSSQTWLRDINHVTAQSLSCARWCKAVSWEKQSMEQAGAFASDKQQL